MGQEVRNNGLKGSVKIYLFFCSSSLDPAQLKRHNGTHSDLKVVPLPCSGRMDILYLTRAFETGADGAIIVTCRHGECRYLEGNLRASKRAQAVNALLEEAGVGGDRILVIEMGESGIEPVIQRIDDFRARLQAISRREKRDGVLTAAS